MSQLKRALPLHLAGVASLLIFASAQGADKSSPAFEGKDTLLRPQGYREWVFVGSSLGLRYPKGVEKPSSSQAKSFNNVYIDPAAFRAFSRTGQFPEGTVMVLEILSSDAKAEPGLQGEYEREFIALEAAVKDRRRFDGGWGYFSFDDGEGKLKEKATPFARASCFECHDKKAALDHVFTQFYPVLRAAQPRK